MYRYLTELYVDDEDMAPVVEGAIAGMLERLDPHSAYLTAEEMQGVRESIDGEFSGIGVEFNVLRDTIIVVNTVAGGPAERAGMRANDRIVRIDTTEAVGFTRADVPKHLRGKTGTKVALEVVRHGVPERLRFTLVRDRIPLNTVDAAYRVSDSVGYIKVNRFGQTTMAEFGEAYRKLGRPGALILDLQGNGGGLLDQAIGMAGFFPAARRRGRLHRGTRRAAHGFRDPKPGRGHRRTAGRADRRSVGVGVGDRRRRRTGLGPGHCRGTAELRQGARAAADRTARRFGRAAHRGPLPHPLRDASSSAPTRRATAANTTSTICAVTTTGRAIRSTPELRPTARCAPGARSMAAEASAPTSSWRPTRRAIRITTRG